MVEPKKCASLAQIPDYWATCIFVAFQRICVTGANSPQNPETDP